MNSTWLERFLVRRKEQLVRKKSSAFIGPSDWVCKMANESVIGRGIPAYSMPNIIDGQFLGELPRRGRNEKFIILFGAYGGRRNGSKGFSDLELALGLLPNEVKNWCELRVFGEEAESCITAGVNTRFLGEVTNPTMLREIYCSADVFAFPSVQETQGMTKVEAMLCGLPVIAFRRTACAEGICHQKTGWIAETVSDFANGIEWFYRKWANGTLDKEREGITRASRELFNPDVILSQVIDVYGRNR